MDHEQIERGVARRSALIYLPIALGAAGLFFLASGLGEHTIVARLGGTAWVGLLSLIVSMPVVSDRVKRRASQRG